jgi:hypothetical protein
VDEKEKGPPNLAPPQVSERSSPPRTLVELGDDQADPAVGDRPKESEEYIEEIFGQLWSIPKSARARVPHGCVGGYLVWIPSDLLRERRVRPEDCFPVSCSQKIDKPPITLSLARDIWGGFG